VTAEWPVERLRAVLGTDEYVAGPVSVVIIVGTDKREPIRPRTIIRVP
jgi:hypothetical protein